MHQKKFILTDDHVVLLKLLVHNDDIHMAAGIVLHSYIIRFRKTDSDTARHYVFRYFEKHYPKSTPHKTKMMTHLHAITTQMGHF